MAAQLSPERSAGPLMAGSVALMGRLAATWNLVAAAAWLAAGFWPGAILHAILAPLLPRLLVGRGSRAVPWLLWVAAWWEVGAVHRWAVPPGRDAAVASVDLLLFGAHLHRAWPAATPWPWLAEIAQLVYLSYYALIAAVPVQALARRRPADFRLATARLVAVYLGCFAICLVMPVYGPRIAEGAGGGGGVLATLAGALRAAGDSPGTAFPSSHCAGSLTAALVARRTLGRRAAFWLMVWAVAVVLSTVRTGNHYAVDALAGVALALGLEIALVLGAKAARASARTAAAGGSVPWPSSW